jgi:hypothetical protein
MDNSHSEIPISQMTFEQLQALGPSMTGWIYPRRNISVFIPRFSGPQRAALNLYGWIAMLMAPRWASPYVHNRQC